MVQVVRGLKDYRDGVWSDASAFVEGFRIKVKPVADVNYQLNRLAMERHYERLAEIGEVRDVAYLADAARCLSLLLLDWNATDDVDQPVPFDAAAGRALLRKSDRLRYIVLDAAVMAEAA